MSACICVTLNGECYTCRGDPFHVDADWRDAHGEPVGDWLRPVLRAELGRALRIGPTRTPTNTNRLVP